MENIIHNIIIDCLFFGELFTSLSHSVRKKQTNIDMDTISSADCLPPPTGSIQQYHGRNNNGVYHTSCTTTGAVVGDGGGFRWSQPNHGTSTEQPTANNDDGSYTFPTATQHQDNHLHHRLMHQELSSPSKMNFKSMVDKTINRFSSSYGGQHSMTTPVKMTGTPNNTLLHHQSPTETTPINRINQQETKPVYSTKDHRIIEETSTPNETSKHQLQVYGNNNTFPTNSIPSTFNNTTPVKDEISVNSLSLPQNISYTQQQQQQQQSGGEQKKIENNSEEEEATKLKVQLMMQQQHTANTILKSPGSSILSNNKDKPQHGGTKAENENNLKTDPSTVQDNGLPSYTAMIAQAILKKETSKSTLSDIYEYMEKYFPSLEKRGTGWRNCVRHTLSLNDCFIKLHRPENGRSCNWAIHPTYHESFSKGDYRKRRALRKRPRGLQWIDPAMLAGYHQFGREHADVYGEMHHHHQPQSPYYHHYSPHAPHQHPSSPQSYYHHPPPANVNYNNQSNYAAPSPSQQQFQQQQTQHHHHQQQPQHTQQPTISNVAPPHYQNHHHQQAPYMVIPQTHSNTHTHHHNLLNEQPHCTNSDCHCQYSKQMFNRVYTP